MTKCKHCPLKDEETPCLSHDRRWGYFCKWADEGRESQINAIVNRSRMEAARGGPDPEPVHVTPPAAKWVPATLPATPAPATNGHVRERTKEDDEMRRAEEARLQLAVHKVESCPYRGGRADCKCDGKRKCGKGKWGGNVTLNNCIDCVQAGGP